VPEDAVETRFGHRLRRDREGGETVKRAVVLGGHHTVDGHDMVEVVTGLEAGKKW
jgi:hypothetical protein